MIKVIIRQNYLSQKYELDVVLNTQSIN